MQFFLTVCNVGLVLGRSRREEEYLHVVSSFQPKTTTSGTYLKLNKLGSVFIAAREHALGGDWRSVFRKRVLGGNFYRI